MGRMSRLFLFLLVSWLLPFPAVAQVTSPPAAPAPAAPAATYVGTAVCKACHQPQFDTFAKTTMGKIFLQFPRTAQEQQGCEGCHGPASNHVARGGGKGVGGLISFAKESATPASQQMAVCQQCHEKGLRYYWKGGPHESRGLTCTSCHRVMEKVSAKNQFVKRTEVEVCFQCHLLRRAQLQLSSHMPLREAKVTCTNCHNPHGSATEKQLKFNSINETCYSCHSERRGPFLWEHPPAAQNCAICHEPHGSSNRFLLRVQPPRLCQQCHNFSFHPATPFGGDDVRRVLNRSCPDCHINIHGSNHPSGSRFVR